MSPRSRSNSETACLVSVRIIAPVFAFHFLASFDDIWGFINCVFLHLCVLAKRSMLLNMTSGSLEAFGGEASRAEL